MKRIFLMLLLVAPVFAQQSGSVRQFELKAGKGTEIPLATPLLRISRYHVSSKFPVTVLFTNDEQLKKLRTTDKPGPCSVSHVREADLWCNNAANDKLVILDARDDSSKEQNQVTVKLVGLGHPTD